MKNYLNHLLFFIIILMLFSVGFFIQYSTSLKNHFDIFNKHIVFFFLLMPATISIIFIPIEKILKINYVVYIVNILILAIVLIIGKTAMGATRWINFGGFNLQPSELAKVSIILALASYFSSVRLYTMNNLIYFLIPILIFIAPTALILLQPNLGTSIIIILIGSTMIFTIFSRTKILVMCVSIILLSMPLIWQFGLHNYQKQRVLTFLNPEGDARGAGYNIIQSKIAIGSGGLFGQGYLRGGQNKLNFLPEQHTDFVFTVFAEEFGFLMGFLLICLYFYFFLKITFYIVNIDNIQDKIILVGCAALIFWHTFINIGMSMDLLPVVGVPLPFISYGRSFLLTNMIIVGLIINIIRKNFILKNN